MGANPQPSTSMGGERGENVKTIPVKGAPKTGQCGHGRGCGTPSAHGHGAQPTGTRAPVPGVVTCAATAAAAGVVVGVLLLHLFEMPSTYTEALL